MIDRLRLPCAEVDDLAGLYVLDALDAAEAAEVAAHLADHPERHPSFAEMAAVTPFLAESVEVVAPPPDLRARVLATIAATPVVDPLAQPGAPTAPAATSVDPDGPALRVVPAPLVPPRAQSAPEAQAAPGPGAASEPPAAPGSPAASGPQAVPRTQAGPERPSTAAPASIDAARERRARRSPLLAVLAAAAVLAIVVLGGWNVLLQQQGAEADRRIALLAGAVAAAGQPGAAVIPMSGTDVAAGASGYAVFPPADAGYIVLTGLPSVADDQTWQAWTLAGGQPASAGLMSVGSDGLAVLEGVERIPGTEVVALTVEPAGGSDGPTTTPVVVGQLGSPLAQHGDRLVALLP